MPMGKHPILKLTPEFRLVAACSWIAPSELEASRRAEIATLCAGQLDWEHVLYLVKLHGIQALVCETLGRLDTIAVPAATMAVLKEWRKVHVVNSMCRATELLRLIGDFRRENIDLVPLKGEILSQRLYGSIGMRCSSDLDVLIRTDDLDAACQLLEEDGYCCSLHGTRLTSKQKKYIRDNLYHLEFNNQSKNVTVELHWRLGSLWSSEQMALVWDNIDILSYRGVEITCQNDNLQLLFLCDHGSRHRFFCLKWLSDIAKAFTSLPDREWQSLLALAEKLDLSATLAHSLLLVHWIYKVPLDDEVASFVYKDKHAEKLAHKVFGLLHLGSFAGVSRGRRLGGVLCSWQVLRLRSSLSFSKTLKPSLIAAGDFRDYPLPDSLFWLYYPLRPFSWLRHYFR